MSMGGYPMLAECDFCGGTIDEAIPDCSTCSCEQEDDWDFYDQDAKDQTLPRRATRWKKQETTKRVRPSHDSPGVLIGPQLKVRSSEYWLYDGDPRMQVHGRWLSGKWGFRMLYVSKAHKLPLKERKRVKRIELLDRIARRHNLTRWNTLPF